MISKKPIATYTNQPLAKASCTFMQTTTIHPTRFNQSSSMLCTLYPCASFLQCNVRNHSSVAISHLLTTCLQINQPAQCIYKIYSMRSPWWPQERIGFHGHPRDREHCTAMYTTCGDCGECNVWLNLAIKPNKPTCPSIRYWFFASCGMRLLHTITLHTRNRSTYITVTQEVISTLCTDTSAAFVILCPCTCDSAFPQL